MKILSPLKVLLLFPLLSMSERVEVKESLVTEGNGEYLVYKMANKGDMAKVSQSEYENVKFYCYQGVEPTVFKFWSSAAFKLDLDSQDYQVYIGPNVTTVNLLHQQSESSWWYTQLPWRSKQFNIDPFQDSCVGVKTAHMYTLELQVKNINYYMFFITLGALFIFFWAPQLSGNQFFHYTTGISAGILLSLLFLAFLIQSRMKRHVFANLFYPLAVYLLTSSWYNIKEYLTEKYIHWFVGYVLSVGLISFAVMYRVGPPSDIKTLNLIQWVMQMVSLVCIVLSSYYQVASISVALIAFLWAIIPTTLKSRVRTQVRKTIFRPKVKLLTEEEYQAQRNEETRKALEQLRNYCRSPESKPWATVTKLSSPSRFAEFIEGSPHITTQEVMDYSHWDSIGTDDEDERSDVTDDDDRDSANRSLDSQGDLHN